ncbi:TRAP transporter substrate-binding protein DctP [Fulvimarina sp. MAC3]|uniref:TRAP transporter substrate-binding protein DctP n=1 Tax=Fulvimarina sp. MAC3 TaxID=3148887 RepID=UPI0031FC621C
MKFDPRKMTARLGLASLALALAASTVAAQTQVTITHSSPEDSHFGEAAKAFKDVVESKADGDFNVVIQRLDNEREAIESVQFGSQECSFTSAGPLGNFIPETRVFDIPFLFDGYDHARGVLDSDIGQDMLDTFKNYGLIGVAWLENGFRNLTTGTKTVNSPDDLKGMKIRTMENEVHMLAWNAAGVLPTPMAFSELPPALQQGTVDGQENPVSVILANNLDQMQSHLYMTRHVYSPGILLCSPAFWDGLSDEQKAIFVEAGNAAKAADRKRVSEDETGGVEKLRERGMEIVEIEDRAPYREAMSSANASFDQEFGADLIKRIREWKPQ